MRYFLLTSEYPPFFGGGIGTYCAHTARMMARAGHETTVVVGDPTLERAEQIEDLDGVRVARFRPDRSLAGACLGADVRLGYEAAQFLRDLIAREGPPDVIESQDYLALAYFLLQQRRTLDPILREVPVQVTLHTPLYWCNRANQTLEYALPNYWIGEMERFAILAADGLVSPSQFLADAVRSDAEMARIQPRVIRYPFEPPPALAAASRGADSGEIIFLGRMERRKGILEFLQAMRALWRDGFDQPVTVLGGDVYWAARGTWMGDLIRAEYREWIDRGLVQFQSPLPQAELYPRLSRARMVVAPSLFENLPYTVAETMALGGVILTSSSGGQAEVVEAGRSGFVFSHTVAGSFAENFWKAYRLPPHERAEVGAAAQERIRALYNYDTVHAQKMDSFAQAREQMRAGAFFPVLRGRCTPAAAGPEAKVALIVRTRGDDARLGQTLAWLAKTALAFAEILLAGPASSADTAQYRRVLPPETGSLDLAAVRAAQSALVLWLDEGSTLDVRFLPRAAALLERSPELAFVCSWSADPASGAAWPAWNPEPPYLFVHQLISRSGLLVRREAFLSAVSAEPLADELAAFAWQVDLVQNGFRGAVIPEAWHCAPLPAPAGRASLTGYQAVFARSADFLAPHGAALANLLAVNGPGYLYANPTVYMAEVGFLQAAAPAPAPAVLSPRQLARAALRTAKQLARRVLGRVISSR